MFWNKKITGEYECIGCGHAWSEPVKGYKLKCPNCTHPYQKWTNYMKLYKKYNWDRPGEGVPVSDI